MISFRTAQLSESLQISNLINSAYRGESSKVGWTTEADILGGIRSDEAMIQEIIQDPLSQMEIVYSPSSIEGLVGCVHLKQIEPKILYFGMLVVRPDLQAQGIGKLLLNHIEDIASQLGCEKIRISVIHTREELISFYERRGFYKTGRSEAFPSHDPRYGEPKVENLNLLEMEKNLRGVN